MNHTIDHSLSPASLQEIHQEILDSIDTPVFLIDKTLMLLSYANDKARSYFSNVISENHAQYVDNIIKIYDEVTLEQYSIKNMLLGDMLSIEALNGHCLLEVFGKNPIPVKFNYQELKSDANLVLFSFTDISRQRNLTDSLHYQRNHDELTGLLKRADFERAIQQAIEDSVVKNTSYIACQIKIAHLKVINDLCGSVAGDELIRELIIIIQNNLQEGDVFCRISGSEFGVVFQSDNVAEVYKQLQLILEMVSQYEFEWGDKPLPVAINVGSTKVDQDSDGWISCMSQIDAACLAASKESENCLKTFSAKDENVNKSHTEISMVSNIISAIQNKRLVLYYQQIVPVVPGKYQNHIEILLRMKNDKGELVSPNAFLPAAETYNLILLIDKWVINNTLLWLKENKTLIPEDLIININLSGLSIGQEGFTDFILKSIDDCELAHSQICFEITETAAIKDFHKASEFIRNIKKAGCIFALDDFGSGMSSFAYLKNLNIDILKIDGSLIRQLNTDKVNRVMVQSINEIAHVMNLKTVAEYVENEEIFQQLRTIGIDFAQGYHFSIPQPLSKFIPAS